MTMRTLSSWNRILGAMEDMLYRSTLIRTKIKSDASDFKVSRVAQGLRLKVHSERQFVCHKGGNNHRVSPTFHYIFPNIAVVFTPLLCVCVYKY